MHELSVRHRCFVDDAPQAQASLTVTHDVGGVRGASSTQLIDEACRPHSSSREHGARSDPFVAHLADVGLLRLLQTSAPVRLPAPSTACFVSDDQPQLFRQHRR